jgi:uncharacterized UPF0146 family protein
MMMVLKKERGKVVDVGGGRRKKVGEAAAEEAL